MVEPQRLPGSTARAVASLVVASGVLCLGAGASFPVLPAVQPNPNVHRVGVLQNGVLTVSLEARQATWRIYGPNRPAMILTAFAEPGTAPLMPGPLLRAPAGTEIRIAVRNTLATPLTFFVPAAVHGGPDRLDAMDSVVVLPGAVGQLTDRLTAPGNYVYRATVPDPVSRLVHVEGALAGALVVDAAGAPDRLDDRIFVIMMTVDSAAAAALDPLRLTPVFTINGLGWPNTERIAATAGDSLHWRVVNASFEPHPMHLHGFYYRVDQFDGPLADRQGRPAPGQMVVTELMTPFSGMAMSWAPDRPGNWIFHCHFALHQRPDSLQADADDPYQRGMVGLVLETTVAPRPGAPLASEPPPHRRLRLIAVADSGAPMRSGDPAPDTVPPMRFILEEQGRRLDTRRAFSPELDLTRGEPVGIMIVNRLAEPISVHWHGMEIEDSYYDGVPGVSGDGTRLTPAIAPGDSFEARFTPPRSGTFMYHAHIDEVVEEQAGLEGALIVRDSGTAPSPDGHVFFLKANHRASAAFPVSLNGELQPDTVILHVGRPARLRFLNLARTNPTPIFSLTALPDSVARLSRDTMVVRWLAVAKDGFTLPAAQQVAHPARQLVSIGETYDFAYTPARAGLLRLEVRALGGRLLERVPIRIE